MDLSRDTGRSLFSHAHVIALIASWVARRKLLRKKGAADGHLCMVCANARSIYSPSLYLFLIIAVVGRPLSKTSKRLCGPLGGPQYYRRRAACTVRKGAARQFLLFSTCISVTLYKEHGNHRETPRHTRVQRTHVCKLLCCGESHPPVSRCRMTVTARFRHRHSILGSEAGA
jgi:hypothetical protein